MSAIFYTYRNGKKEDAFKFEKVDYIWYTKDKEGKDQITVKFGKDLTRSSWGLDPEDVELTQKSHEKACEKYNESLIKIGHLTGKKRKVRKKDPKKKRPKKRQKRTR